MSTATTHRASLGAILSIITGKLVCPLDELYALQDFLVRRPLMTHERAEGWESQTEALLRQFPRLAEVEAPDFSIVPRSDVEVACRAWVADVAAHVGWTEADVAEVEGCEVDPAVPLNKIMDGMAKRYGPPAPEQAG